jgi:uncharacterized protein YjbI with pentapeptide repeats
MAQVYDKDDLKNAEEQPSGHSSYSTSTRSGNIKYSTKANKKESGDELSSTTPIAANSNITPTGVPSAEDSLYKNASSATQPGKVRFSNLLGTRRRKIIFGGGAATTIVGITIFLTFLSGPLEFIHLSQILQRNFAGSNFTATIRNKGLFRYARTGNVEETRLGALGSKVYNRTISQLNDQGVDFVDKNARGVPRTMTIDPTKNDSYRGLTAAEQRTAILNDYKITNPNILFRDAAGIYRINLTNTTLSGIDFVKATSATAIGSLNNGKLETGLATRYVKTAWDLPG